MGNVLDIPKSGDSRADDLEWLSIQNSAIFNDAYVSGVYDELPKFEGSEVDKNVVELKREFQAETAKINRLLEILSKPRGGTTSVLDFENLSSTDETENSTFAVTNKMRCRLLQRIHLALLREATNSKESDDNRNENFLSLVEDKKNFEDANALLTASSIHMVIAFAKCLGPSNPELFRAMSETLLELLTRSSSLALSNVESGSPQEETINAIMSYAEEVACRSFGDDRAYALALMLAVAVTSGSVKDILSVAKHLRDGTEKLPSAAHIFLKRLEETNTELKLSIPTPTTTAGEFKANVNINVEEKDVDKLSSVISTDGVHLYIWDSMKYAIYKIGTGFHGTIAGNQYMSNTDVESQLRERLHDDIQEHITNVIPTPTPTPPAVLPSPNSSSSTAVTSPCTSSTQGIRRARIIRTTRIIHTGAQDLASIINEEGDPEGFTIVEPGTEIDILEERLIPLVLNNYDDDQITRNVPFYRVGEGRWLLTYCPEEDEELEDSEDEDEEDEDDEDEMDSPRIAVEFMDGYVVGGNTPFYSQGNHLTGSNDMSATTRGDTSIHNRVDTTSSSGGNGGSSISESFTYATWLVCASGKLYLRMHYLLGPHRLAVFSTSALKLEDIIEIDLPIPSLIKAKKIWDKRFLTKTLSSKDGDASKDSGDNDVGSGSDSTSMVDKEEENEVEVECVTGEEVNFCTVAYGASVVAASSNYSTGEELINLITPLESNSSDEDLEFDDAFDFADTDRFQYLTVDLGQLRIIKEIGSSFYYVDGEEEEDGDEWKEEEYEEKDSPVSESMNVYVSVDSIEYILWGSISEDNFTSRCVVPKTIGYEGPTEIRYIKYYFGRKDSSSFGSSIYKLYAYGNLKVKKGIHIPFPALCSDGRHLIFIHENSEKGKSGIEKSSSSSANTKNEKETVLHTYMIDPLYGMKTQSERIYDWGLPSNLLQQCSFVCNSEKIIVSHRKTFSRRNFDEKEVEVCFHRLDMLKGKMYSSNEILFNKQKGIPLGICYDARNNMLWGWDSYSLKMNRWRNDGLAPRYGPPRPELTSDLLLSSSPQYRLEALSNIPMEERDAKAEAALIICQLDRLAELHCPPVLIAAESNATNEIEVTSAGHEDIGGHFCRLLVRGQHCGTNETGFNLVVLDEQLNPAEARNYNTHESSSASERMADFIDAIPDGRLVLVATVDSAVNCLSTRGCAAIRSLGADKIEKLGFRGSFAMIGRKGVRSGIVPQSMAEKKLGPVTVRQRLPTQKIALAVEATLPTLSTLVQLIASHYAKVKSGEATQFDKVMLIGSFRLLTTNIFQLLRGTPVKFATEIFTESDRQIIMSIVMEVIDKPLDTEGSEAISDGALRLFITSIDVLYPTAGEKCALLVRYLNDFVEETLSDLERSVLELLLRQMSNPTSLVKLLHGKDEVKVTEPIALLNSLLSIAKKETVLRLQGLEPGQMKKERVGYLVGEAAVQMLATLCNLMLSQGTQAIITSKNEGNGKLTEDTGSIILKLLVELSDACVEILNTAISINAALWTPSTTTTSETAENPLKLDEEVDEILKASPVGALLSTILNVISQITKSKGAKMIGCGLPMVADTLTHCLMSVQCVLDIIPAKRMFSQAFSDSHARTSTAVFESDHPYLPNTDKITEMSFPGAIKITCIFDDRSKTENNYDYIKIFKDALRTETWHPLIEKFTGRNGSENWPGCGGRPPLVIEGDCAWIEFHSDGSNEDWGWRFTAIAEYKRSANTAQVHWLVELERQLSFCCATIASTLVVSLPWDHEVEDRNAVWMEDQLLEAGFSGMENEMETEVTEDRKLLNELVDRPQESLALALCKRMKRFVMEDRGQVDDINRAAYATCAALIKHNNLTSEALAVAKGDRHEPSEKLIKVWKAGQKMRSLFDVNDMKSSLSFNASNSSLLTDHIPIPVLQRGPSTFSAITEKEVVRQTVEEVVRRAQFLLRVHPPQPVNDIQKRWTLIAGNSLLPSFTNSSETTPIFTNTTMTTTASSVAISPPLTTTTTTNDEISITEKFQSIVHEVHTSNKLKEMFAYRRITAQRRNNANKNSITERVLRFIQSNVRIENLEKLRIRRNLRAEYRLSGYDFLGQLSVKASTPFSIKTLMLMYAKEIQSTKRSERVRAHVHYLNGLEGCSYDISRQIMVKFAQFLNNTVNLLNHCYTKCRGNNMEGEELQRWVEVVASLIRACAIDYDIGDHQILNSSNIITVLEKLLRAPVREINRPAWSLFEVLLPRCVGLEGQRIEVYDEPSEFSKKLVALLVTELDRACQSVLSQRLTYPVVSTENEPLPPYSVLLGGVVELRRDNLGYVHPHVDLNLRHTFSLWIRRKRSIMETDLMERKLRDGSRVCRGPDWQVDNVEDGGPDCLGTVFYMESNTVTVRWDNKLKKTYKCGALVEGEPKYEVIPVDETLQGGIYSKGVPAILEEEARSRVWSLFGLRLRCDATLQVFAASGEDQMFRHQSKTPLPPETWTHVTVVQDRSKNRIYLNGVLDSEKVVESQMLNPSKAGKLIQHVESPHPYRDNSDEYTIVEVKNARGYLVTFDPQTKTELNYDYIRFYKDDSHSDYWGEDKYSGGRGGGASNWPGCHGRPPLKIPSSRFVVYFKSDGSNNDWGYKISCVADVPVEVVDEHSTITVLNRMPIYIGQTPTYVGGEIAAEVMLSNILVFPCALTEPHISSLCHPNNRPDVSFQTIDEILCLDVLTMMERGGVHTHGVYAMGGPHVLLPLLSLVAYGSPAVRVTALRLCATVLPSASTDMVNTQTKRLHLISDESFLQYLVHDIGRGLNVWTYFSDYYQDTSPSILPTTTPSTDNSTESLSIAVAAPSTTTNQSQINLCSELEYSIICEEIRLLQALASTEVWASAVQELITSVVSTLKDTLNSLSVAAQQEIQMCKSLPVVLPSLRKELNTLFAVLGLLGGCSDGLLSGARALYMMGDDSSILEECTILTPTTPPPLKADDKAGEALWKGQKSFGDAFVIVLNSQRGVPLTVPRHKLTTLSQLAMTPSFSDFLKTQSESLMFLFREIALTDCVDRRLVPVPNIVESDETTTFESSHPYLHNSDLYTHIKFPGAKKIIIEFDPLCRTEAGCDYVRFYKDDNRSGYWGDEKYHGKDQDGNWPGVRGKAPLVIPSDSCVLYFHSDGISNEWGYKFTARAHCIQRTEPPVRPPLLHLSLLSHIKLMGMKSLSTLLLSCDWLVERSIQLIQPLLSTALSPTPRIKSTSSASKPLMLESNHPYEHNKDEYTPVKIRGAKHLIITFDEQTATENGCDYVRFYKDDQRSEYWGESQYTGGKDGSNSTWPSIKGRPPLIIPSDSFVLYFHTDGSVNAWGWRMWVTPDSGSASLINVSPSMCAYRTYCLLQLLKEGPEKMPVPSGMEVFKHEDWTKHGEASTDLSALVISTSGNGDSPVLSNDIPTNNNIDHTEKRIDVHQNQWPRYFVVNSRDAFDVAVRERPTLDSPVLFTITLGKRVLAKEEKNDWLLVQLCSTNIECVPVPDKIGWAHRRLEDQIFLIPIAKPTSRLSSGNAAANTTAAPSLIPYDELITIDDDDVTTTTVDSIKTKVRHPMYTVDENSSSSNVPTEVQPSPLQILRGNAECSERAASEFAECGAIGYAQDCITNIISRWPADMPFKSDFFGDNARLLLYIKATFLKETSASSSSSSNSSSSTTSASSSSSLNTLKQRLLEVVRADDTTAAELCNLLMRFALRQLLDNYKAVKCLRPTRALVKTIETKHPYDDNMDVSWELSIPGAKWMRLVFDKRSSSEKDCDYCIIYKTIAKTDTWGPRYTGRSNSTDRIWAGVGNAPPLKVLSDSCVVFFHSDGSNTDWGFKLSAYGVIEEPSEEEREQQEQAKSGINQGNVELACWILDFLAKEQNSVVLKTLYAPDCIRTLHKFVKSMPTSKKEFIVHLLTNMIQELPRVPLLDETLEEIRALKKTIIELCNKQYKEETAGVTGAVSEVSPLLQALVQAAVVIDSSMLSLNNSSLSSLSSTSSDSPRSTASSTASSSNSNGQAVQGITESIKDSSNISPKFSKTEIAFGEKSLVKKDRKPSVSASHRTAIDDSCSSVDTFTWCKDFSGMGLNILSGKPYQRVLQMSMSSSGSIQDSLQPEVLEGEVKTKSSAEDTTPSSSKNSPRRNPKAFKSSRPYHEKKSDSSITVSLPLPGTDSTVIGGDGGGDGAKRAKSSPRPTSNTMSSSRGKSMSMSTPVVTKSTATTTTSHVPSIPVLDTKADEKIPSTITSNQWSTAVCSTQGFHFNCRRFSVFVKSINSTDPMTHPVIGMTARPLAQGQGFHLAGQLGSYLDCSSFGWGGGKLSVNGNAMKPFGPILREGDTVSIEIDFDRHTVTYYRNQALVGVAIGPIGSGALMELDFGRGPYYPAVSIAVAGDTVELLDESYNNPLPSSSVSSSSSNASSTDSEMPSWFDPIREAVTLLRSCATRELPSSVISREFIPACEEKAKVVIESSHPFDGNPLLRRVSIPGADSLTVYFHDTTRMGAEDIIRITGSVEDNRGHILQHEYLGLDGGTDLTVIRSGNSGGNWGDTICVGDKVVRGKAWDWGDQDGGAGSYGEVTSIRSWKGKPGAGVVVKWHNGNEGKDGKEVTAYSGLYRWDYEGLRDLIVVGQWEKSRRPLHVSGSELVLEVLPGLSPSKSSSKLGNQQSKSTDSKSTDSGAKDTGGEQSSEWCGAAVFNGTSSRIIVTNRNELELNGDCTVEAWVRLSSDIIIPSLGRDNSVYPIVIRQIEIDTKISQFSFQLGFPQECGSNTLVLHMVNESLQPALHLTGGSIPIGCWTHVAAIVSGTTATLLVNGVVVNSGRITSTRLSSLDAPLYIGADDDGHCLRGCLHDVRIWNKGLTPEAVAANRMSAIQINSYSNNLVCHLLANVTGPFTDNIVTDLALYNRVDTVGLALAMDIGYDSSIEPTVIATGVKFGFKCTIKPNFSLTTILQYDQFRGELERLRAQYTVGSLRHDLALVRYINQKARSKSMNSESLLKAKWQDIAPQEDELVRAPILKEIVQMEVVEVVPVEVPPPPKPLEAYGVYESKESDDSPPLPPPTAATTTTTTTTTTAPIPPIPTVVVVTAPPVKPLRPVEARFALLQMLNKALAGTIAFVDLCMTDRSWSIAYLLAACRGLLFETTTMPCWETAMQATSTPSGGQFELRLSRSRAIKHMRTGLPDDDARYMVFSQAFRQMHTMSPSALRRTEKLYNTILMGERAQDAGGPYRESYAIYAQELQSSSLPLLIRTPNGRHSVGQNREKWLLNPGSTTSTHLEMFAFMGKLMGIAIRTKEYLALNIPSIIWKLLVQDTPTREDLEAIDLFQIQSLDSMRHIEDQGFDEESFSKSFYETFTTISSDDRVVELKPGGNSMDVTFATRNEFCDLVEAYRLHEFDVQAAAVRRGMGTIVPARLLSLFTWDQLEVMVCGVPEIDVNLLQKVTEYSSCSSSDEHIKFFWKALDEFSMEERSMFLRFTWGRSRLPLSAEGFSQRFKLQSFGKSPPDAYFPVAHTCFFSLELPRYSHIDVMKEKLRYAIYNCQAIDGDDTSLGLQAASMGWEE